MNDTITAPITVDMLSAAVGYPIAPTELRLRLSQYHSVNEDGTAGFVQRWGKRIQAVGGKYERVQYEQREVKLPVTNEALALADDLLRSDPNVGRTPERTGWDYRPRLCLRGLTAWQHRTYDRAEPWVLGTLGEIHARGGSLCIALRNVGKELTRDIEKGNLAHPDKIAEVAELARLAKEKAAAVVEERERAEKVRDAAPAMLAALRAAFPVLKDEANKHPAPEWDAIVRSFREAITQATGAQP